MSTISEKFRSAPPRGGLWTYTHPISGHKFSSPQIPALKDSIWRHEEANGYPISTEQSIEDQLCINHPFSCDDQAPGLVEQAGSLIKAVVNFAKSGFVRTSEEVLQQRLDICQACEYFRGIVRGSDVSARCRKCGCNIGPKIMMASERCPLGKWEAVA